MTRFEYTLLISPFHLDVLNAQGQKGLRYIDKLENPAGGPPLLIFERQIADNINQEQPFDVEVEEVHQNPEEESSVNAKLKKKLAKATV